MVELKLIEVPEVVFNKILEDYESNIIYMKNIWNCFCGTPDNKKSIYTDNNEWIVCPEFILDYVCYLIYGNECIAGCTDWKQVRVRKVLNLNAIQLTYNGSYCYNYIMKILKKYYNTDEIENIFKSHEREYDPDLKQLHYNYVVDTGELIELENCVKYDINGAHAKAIIDLFPAAKDALLKLYNKKDYYKKKGDISGANKIKALFNFFVGALCNKGHRGTYNYIVQSVTKQIMQAEEYLGGVLVYENTDSICVMNPDNKYEDSKVIGDFKLESDGTMYVYRDKNYWLLEYINRKGITEQVGSCKLLARTNVSLKDGNVVHYDVTRELIGIDESGHKHFKENIINIKEEHINGI